MAEKEEDQKDNYYSKIHLHHGQVDKLNPAKAQILEKLETLSMMIANSDEVDEGVEEQMNKVLTNYQVQFKQFIVAYTRAKISRVTKLMQTLDNIEDELLSVDRIQKARTFELIKMRSAVSQSLKSILDLVLLAKDVDLPMHEAGGNVYVQNNVIFNDTTMLIQDKGSRQSIRDALRNLISTVNTPKAIDGEEQEL